MAADISRHMHLFFGRCAERMAREAAVHPYLLIVLLFFLCPMLMIFALLMLCAAVMVPVSWLMGWL